jgi:hypothetical protein
LISGGNFRIDFKGDGCHNFTTDKLNKAVLVV